MRYVLGIAAAIACMAIGWFGHEILAKPPTPRAASARTVVEAPPAPVERVSLPPAPSHVEEEKVSAEGGETLPAGTADPELDRLREMIVSQSKMWKGFAGMQMKQRADALLASLPFDAAREQKIKDLLQKEAELQAERAAMMMLGEEEFDQSAFEWFMGMPSELSASLEHELATFLNDGEMQVVRAEVKRAREKQMSDMADMQIGMMQIHDLSDDQRTRMREVYSGTDMMTEQFSRFGEIVRDRDRMRRLLRGEGIEAEMERQFEGTRRRVRDILTPEQYRKYEIYEQGLVRQAQMGLKMMSAFLEKPREGTQAPASK
jgi:hypothetical protein